MGECLYFQNHYILCQQMYSLSQAEAILECFNKAVQSTGLGASLCLSRCLGTMFVYCFLTSHNKDFRVMILHIYELFIE